MEQKMARRIVLLLSFLLLCGPVMAGPFAPVPGPSPDFDTALSASSCWPGRHFWPVAGGEADRERLAAPQIFLVERKMARQLIILVASLLFCGPAMAGLAAVPGPSPDFDTGLVGFVMLAGAAYLAYRRRRS
jgi:LPXTG-motif cell wall-anchored protein